MTGAPTSTKCRAICSGRSVGAPVPVAAPGQKTSRDRPRSRSRLGMTCTLGVRSGGGPLAQHPAVIADGKAAGIDQLIVEAAQGERVAEPLSLLIAEAEQQRLPEQVAQLVRR